MAGGATTQTVFAGIGALAKSIPPEYQSTFATGAQLAGIGQPAATPAGGSMAANSAAPGPAPASGGFGDFMRSTTGKVVGIALVLGLGYMLYKGRA